MQLDILYKEILIHVSWKITSLRNILTLILIKIHRTKNENNVNIIYKLYYYYTNFIYIYIIYTQYYITYKIITLDLHRPSYIGFTDLKLKYFLHE